jgi:hypothetical protein
MSTKLFVLAMAEFVLGVITGWLAHHATGC